MVICIPVSLLASKHEQDGRVILAEFETFRLLNTYAPNNGWKEEENSFQRRRKWDKRLREFFLQTADKPLIWCGDLNVRWVTGLQLLSSTWFVGVRREVSHVEIFIILFYHLSISCIILLLAIAEVTQKLLCWS